MYGEDNLRNFYYNYICRNLNRQNGKLIICKKAVLDIHETAKINLYDDFYVNADLFKGSNAEGYLKMQENSILNINGRFKLLYSSTIQLFKNATLTLGNGYINSNSVISCCNNITIGDGVMIARGVHIYDGDFHSILDDNDNILNKPEPINIGNHVWIGLGSTILKGVKIGDGSIVGAGSLVNKDVPPNCMVAGNPAKIIKENVKWK